MKRTLSTILFSLACGLSAAAPAPAPVRAEIDALLARLQASGCQFNRNGTWHSAADARNHLLRKLDYLEDKGKVQSTEQFIALAASGSSSSGKPYKVKCGAEAGGVDSAAWLGSELAAIRAAKR